MNYLIPLSEFGTYLFISILAGCILLQFIPETSKPKSNVSNKLLLFCVLGLIIFTFMPLLQIVLVFKNKSLFFDILYDTNLGRAWLMVLLFSVLLWVTIYVDGSKVFCTQLMLLIIFSVGNGSHAASISPVSGAFSHSVHLLATSIWAGVLIVTGWFSSGSENWGRFLKWFTPVAFSCFLTAAATGFVLMSSMAGDRGYVDIWGVSYGGMLLIKHICIIPVLAFAFINGVLSRRLVKDPAYNPYQWVRFEGIFLMLVFYFTGYLGTMVPPHEVDFISSYPGNLTWWNWIFNQELYYLFPIALSPSAPAYFLIVFAMFFLLMILISFKKAAGIYAIIFAGCFIITFYLGMIFSAVPGANDKFKPSRIEDQKLVILENPPDYSC